MADPNIHSPHWDAELDAPFTGTVLAMTGPGAGHVFPAGTDRPVMEMLLTGMEAAGEHEGDAS